MINKVIGKAFLQKFLKWTKIRSRLKVKLRDFNSNWIS